MESTEGGGYGRTRLTAAVAVALFALVLVEVAVAGVGAVLAGMTLADAVAGYLVTNAAIGLAGALSGLLLAWHRPRNPIGWLLAVGGVLQTLTAAASPLLTAAVARGWSEGATRGVATVYAFAWPCAIGFCLPAALLLFPTGRLPGPRWRGLAGLVLVVAPLFVLENGTDPGGAGPGGSVHGLLVLDPTTWTVIAAIAEWGFVLVLVGVLASLVARYRRGDDRTRRQLLWLVLATLVVAVDMVLWGPTAIGLPVLNLLVIALIPVAITVAVLRHQLLDIRLVVSRAVLYVLLSAVVLGVWLGLVTLLELVLRRQAGFGVSAVATLVVVLGAAPARVWLQRLVDRAFYGDRGDPVRAMSRLGEQLAVGEERDVLAAIGEALRLPSVAVHARGRERVAWSRAPGEGGRSVARLPLRYGGEEVAELVVGVRRGQGALDRSDRAALELLAAPLAAAVHARALADDVATSRTAIVAAREEERRRLRRDLHDGLGPALTGIGFRADAARNLVPVEPERAGEVLATLRGEVSEAIEDVRRLVRALRPPSLDELGLVGALRRHLESAVDGSVGGAPAIVLDLPDTLPPLPAAVETAAYRIATEGVVNAVRHARSTSVTVALALHGRELEVTVSDDGAGGEAWSPGVGLTAMRERADEVGGRLEAGPRSDGGGRVRTWLPLPAESATPRTTPAAGPPVTVAEPAR
ncbi:histidine kinase [Actinomycetospora sp.]|uniref:sensor histidine kinase n=1 Tax=Actinomycetospora sp. TaxID=1872135 RepID=UPI002F40A4C4